MRAGPLLDDAEHLLTRRGRPTPETTGRAVSNAYYALFHTLKNAANKRLVGDGQASERTARWFNHASMRAVCTWFNRSFGAKSPAKSVIDLLSRPNYPGPIADWLCSAVTKEVADAFVELQEMRHRADYGESLADRFSKAQALYYVALSRRACAAVDRLSATEDGKLFMLLLLTTDRVISDR